jgi:hypothetical protein
MFDEAGVEPRRMWAAADPLPADACVARIEARLPSRLGIGEVVTPVCSVTNLSDHFFVSAPPNPVHLAYRWRGAGGAVVEGERARLPGALPPRAMTEVPLLVVAPQEAGVWQLDVTLVQEHVRWFDETTPEAAVSARIEVVGSAL